MHYAVTDTGGRGQELLTEGGTIVWRGKQQLWGREEGRNRDDAPDCRLRFPGQYEDAESGLYYNRFRYYDPDTAQYISADPTGVLGGINPYSYVKDPLNWIDPLGLNADCVWKAADIKNSENWNGCEDFALWVQKKIGGDIARIRPDFGAPSLGKYRGTNPGWAYHDVVVKDGRVYDAFTGSDGLPLQEYKELWQYPDAINFGF